MNSLHLLILMCICFVISFLTCFMYICHNSCLDVSLQEIPKLMLNIWERTAITSVLWETAVSDLFELKC